MSVVQQSSSIQILGKSVKKFLSYDQTYKHTNFIYIYQFLTCNLSSKDWACLSSWPTLLRSCPSTLSFLKQVLWKFRRREIKESRREGLVKIQKERYQRVKKRGFSENSEGEITKSQKERVWWKFRRREIKASRREGLVKIQEERYQRLKKRGFSENSEGEIS